MSRRFLSVVTCFLTVIPLTALGQDTGIPDTVRFIGDTLVIGRSMPVHVHIFNDEEIVSFGLGMLAETVDGGFARFDSVTHTGRLTDPSVLNLRLTSFYSVDGISPDTLAHACLRVGGNLLTPGSDVVLNVYF